MNVNREMLAFLRKQYPVGTRIRLDSMQDPYAPVEAGTTGKLDYIDDAEQFHIKWDNGRVLALIPGVDSFTVLPPELSMTKLYMPLTAELYEPDVYGNMQEEPELLTGHDLTAYEDHIRSALVKYRMPEEVNRGIMHWYDAADSVNDKVRSVTFSVERRNGKLWGIAECQISGELSAAELTTLKEYIEGQASDGWGEGFEQHEIAVGRGSELYVHLWQDHGWNVQTEQERFRAHFEKLPEMCFSLLPGTGQLMDKLVHSASFAPASSLYLSIALQPYFGYALLASREAERSIPWRKRKTSARPFRCRCTSGCVRSRSSVDRRWQTTSRTYSTNILTEEQRL